MNTQTVESLRSILKFFDDLGWLSTIGICLLVLGIAVVFILWYCIKNDVKHRFFQPYILSGALVLTVVLAIILLRIDAANQNNLRGQANDLKSYMIFQGWLVASDSQLQWYSCKFTSARIDEIVSAYRNDLIRITMKGNSKGVRLADSMGRKAADLYKQNRLLSYGEALSGFLVKHKERAFSMQGLRDSAYFDLDNDIILAIKNKYPTAFSVKYGIDIKGYQQLFLYAYETTGSSVNPDGEKGAAQTK